MTAESVNGAAANCAEIFSPRVGLRREAEGAFLRSVFKKFFTNNFPAKVVSVLLATLLWAVIKQRPLNEQMPAQPKQPEANVSFGAGAYGK